MGYPLPKFPRRQDTNIWKFTEDGVFSTRSTYLALINEFFIWITWRDRLFPKARRASLGLSSSSSYLACGHLMENLIHILRDCPIAKKVWNRGLPASRRGVFFSWDLCYWLKDNLLASSQARLFLSSSLLRYGICGKNDRPKICKASLTTSPQSSGLLQEMAILNLTLTGQAKEIIVLLEQVVYFVVKLAFGYWGLRLI
ncbi:hypothetical protein F3Y22_tig00002237pilonHSYRG01164 [Hibiscus syriacus]|uniref:Reverse transcriptase zinc-binding domain-containing protein n=1 Tax=Hibiscus syriacus TaxID=106335 RepID=A0A6A3CYA5_HIBSY|nr:hypothetical protein F3Y22_tig00002237pilonHSYRG01164 [Hibiscus syriacus]